MLRYLFCATISFVMLFTLITHSMAQERQKVRIKQITGDVVVYDPSIKTMTVKGKKAEVVIVLDDKTIIKEKKNLKSYNDIKIGDKVLAKYTETEGKNIAKTIEIKTDINQTKQ